MWSDCLECVYMGSGWGWHGWLDGWLVDWFTGCESHVLHRTRHPQRTTSQDQRPPQTYLEVGATKFQGPLPTLATEILYRSQWMFQGPQFSGKGEDHFLPGTTKEVLGAIHTKAHMSWGPHPTSGH